MRNSKQDKRRNSKEMKAEQPANSLKVKELKHRKEMKTEGLATSLSKVSNYYEGSCAKEQKEDKERTSNK